MLRVGLTGGLGSGKSTAARMFKALGAYVLSSDEIGRSLMQPGEAVHAEIVRHFGTDTEVCTSDGSLDRAILARLAFADGRVEELNAIVHPAVLDRQRELARQIGAVDANAIVVVESALIFETNYSETNYSETKHSDTSVGGAPENRWHTRFNKIVLVSAPEELKVRRFVQRSSAGRELDEVTLAALEDEAYRRLAKQMPDELKIALSDYVLTNGGSVQELEWQVDRLWPLLVADAHNLL